MECKINNNKIIKNNLCVIKNKGPRIEPCGTPCLTSSQLEQLTVLVLSFNATV